jgi:hypothetical protein
LLREVVVVPMERALLGGTPTAAKPDSKYKIETLNAEERFKIQQYNPVFDGGGTGGGLDGEDSAPKFKRLPSMKGDNVLPAETSKTKKKKKKKKKKAAAPTIDEDDDELDLDTLMYGDNTEATAGGEAKSAVLDPPEKKKKPQKKKKTAGTGEKPPAGGVGGAGAGAIAPAKKVAPLQTLINHLQSTHDPFGVVEAFCNTEAHACCPVCTIDSAISPEFRHATSSANSHARCAGFEGCVCTKCSLARARYCCNANCMLFGSREACWIPHIRWPPRPTFYQLC